MRIRSPCLHVARRLAGSLLVLFVTADPGVSVGLEDPVAAPTGTSLLEHAFELRFGRALRAEVDIRIRDVSGSELHRTIRVASKRIRGRLHAIGRVRFPEYLRGMGILTVENGDRGTDAFVFMPSIGKARRVTLAHQTDPFLGSDLTYEDLGSHRAADYHARLEGVETWEGEDVFRVHALPAHPSTYEHVEFLIGRDHALLAARYFRRNTERPFRVLRMPRHRLRQGPGYSLPTVLVVENHRRGTVTRIDVRDLEVDATIDDRELSVLALESGRTPGPAEIAGP